MSWMDEEMRRHMLFEDSMRKSVDLASSKSLLGIAGNTASIQNIVNNAASIQNIASGLSTPRYIQDMVSQNSAIASLVAQPSSIDYIRQISEATAIVAQTTTYWQHTRHLFQVPDAIRLSDIASGAFAVRNHLSSVADTVTAMSRIQAPWMDTRNPLGSVDSFASILEIGRGVTRTPFEAGFTSSLRNKLGDWREVVEVPSAILEDPEERTEFYLERGFRAELVDFPPDALEEIIENAGLAAPDDEENHAWRDRVSPYIGRIESRLRRYVNAIMTEAFGEDWTKRVHGDILRRWKATKEKRIAEGRPELPHLIYYSEFSDLQLIMQPRDHFVFFKPKFQRVESMQEIFLRVLPARNAVAHAGIVTPIDYFTVMTEYARLRHVIDWEE
jgi:hypothetical protein